MTTPTPDEICDAIALAHEAADLIQQQQATIERLSAALVAMADAADKCSEAPHFIVQPFLGIYRKHGETIAEARATLGKAGS